MVSGSVWPGGSTSGGLQWLAGLKCFSRIASFNRAAGLGWAAASNSENKENIIRHESEETAQPG